MTFFKKIKIFRRSDRIKNKKREENCSLVITLVGDFQEYSAAMNLIQDMRRKTWHKKVNNRVVIAVDQFKCRLVVNEAITPFSRLFNPRDETLAIA